MTSNEERRKVAQRLRDDARIGALPCSDFFGAVAYDVGVEKERAAVLNRLADLIEPSEPEVKYVAEVKVDGWRLEELAHGAAVELTGIDRDALLELPDSLVHVVHDSVDKLIKDLEIASCSRIPACGYFCHTAEDGQQSCDHCPSADVPDKTCSQVFIEDITKRIKELMKDGAE